MNDDTRRSIPFTCPICGKQVVVVGDHCECTPKEIRAYWKGKEDGMKSLWAGDGQTPEEKP